MRIDTSCPSLLTIGTCNRRAGIAVLLESFHRNHPAGRAFVCLVDRPSLQTPPLDLQATTFYADELQLPGGRRFLFKYEAFELCCALKPFAMQHLLQRQNLSRLVYLDSDIFVTHAFWPDLEKAWENRSIILTPHLLRLPEGLSFDLQRSLVQHGAYNGGFLGLEKCAASIEFLQWWCSVLERGCTFDPMNNIYVDQRWLDLAAASCKAVGVLRDPGFNVAYWNLHERKLRANGSDSWTVNGQPLKFFHFSGFDSKFVTTKVACTDENAITLAHVYGELLQQARSSEFANCPYGWDIYSDGNKIHRQHRDLILADHPELAHVTDPFQLHAMAKEWQIVERLTAVTAPFRIGQRYLEADKAAVLLQRLYEHPVLGLLWKLWTRFVNSSLRPYLPPHARS
jgi:hypothetical protein